jgi:hypothetical protein
MYVPVIWRHGHMQTRDRSCSVSEKKHKDNHQSAFESLQEDGWLVEDGRRAMQDRNGDFEERSVENGDVVSEKKIEDVVEDGRVVKEERCIGE